MLGALCGIVQGAECVECQMSGMQDASFGMVVGVQEARSVQGSGRVSGTMDSGITRVGRFSNLINGTWRCEDVFVGLCVE